MKNSPSTFAILALTFTLFSPMNGAVGAEDPWSPRKPENRFTVTIFRQATNRICTCGYLAVNGKVICYSLELPDRDNKEYLSSIPAGAYEAHIRYDHRDHWRIELEGVPGRTSVQIHIGNSTDDSLGCILVGRKIDLQRCRLEDSSGAYQDLKVAMYGRSDPPVQDSLFDMIEVHVIDAGKQNSVLHLGDSLGN